jgi:hypothetical protein
MTYPRLVLSEFDKRGEFFTAAETSERDASRLIPIEQCIDFDDLRSVTLPLGRTSSMREERGHKFPRAGNLNDDLAVADLQGAASVRRAAVDGSRGV